MNTRSGKCCSVLWNLFKSIILCSRIIIIIFYIKWELVWNRFIFLVRELLVTCHLLFRSTLQWSTVTDAFYNLSFCLPVQFLCFCFNADSRILSFRNLLTVHPYILSSFEFHFSVNTNRDILRNYWKHLQWMGIWVFKIQKGHKSKKNNLPQNKLKIKTSRLLM